MALMHAIASQAPFTHCDWVTSLRINEHFSEQTTGEQNNYANFKQKPLNINVFNRTAITATLYVEQASLYYFLVY